MDITNCSTPAEQNKREVERIHNCDINARTYDIVMAQNQGNALNRSCNHDSR